MTLSKVEQEALEIMATLTDRERIPVFMSSKTEGLIPENFVLKGGDSRLGQESNESSPETLPKPKHPHNEEIKN